MTREELRDYVEEQRNLNNIPYHAYSELIDIIDSLEHELCCETKIIDEHYKKGFANGLRTAEWRYNNAIAEIKEQADGFKNNLYGDGLRHALEILNEYRTEGREINA